MDLRVYVDGIARIICDLTRTTTVHDIIIALAQYKGKPGRYSLIERAPDGTQRTLSPSELTSELIYHPNWLYILKQNSTNSNSKRSKSLDGRKTPVQQQQSTIEIPSAVTSSSLSSSTTSAHIHPNTFSTLSSIKSSEKKKLSQLHNLYPSANVNNNNNNHMNTNDELLPIAFFIEQKRSSRTPIQIIEQDLGILDNRHSRTETSAFHLVHNSQHQQYIALLKLLKTQELQVEQQDKELNDKQREIDYREKTLQQNTNLENEFYLLTEHDRYLTSECKLYPEEYIKNELDKEYEYEKKLHQNYEHLQQQITRSKITSEQKRQLQEQIQVNIQQTHHEIEQMQTNITNDKKDIDQYQKELECINTTHNQQEDLIRMLTQRNDEIERNIEQRREQITELENELIQLDDILKNNLLQSYYQFRPNSSTPQHYNSLPSTGPTTDVLMPVRLQFVNSTLWKLCPSGIWV